jgi:signal transduction histidine kinase
MNSNQGSAAFQPKARIIKLLGDELITNEVIAMVELVKNSYDADAPEVKITLENVRDPECGRIVIHDNGIGMNLDTILNAWLQPGTDIKKKNREKSERSRIFHRPILGEKGVGRFAAQKLGSLITLTTRSKEDKLETSVEVNWKEFERDKLLSEIPVRWIRIEPKTFRENQTGTSLEIRFLAKPWTKEMVSNLAQKLVSLQSPFREERDFEITIESEEFPEVAEQAKFPINLFSSAVYSLSGTVSDEGILRATYRFLNPAFKQFERPFEIRNIDIKEPSDFKSDGSIRKPMCGGLAFRFYVWDLDPLTLRETVSRKTYNTYIQPLTGIRIYRDNFRVWPYGEQDNDWLELDIRRVNNPSKCLSNNQIIGLVQISHDTNPALRDKTDREGLIENLEYKDFKNLTLSTINQLEILRRQDKDKVDHLRERKTGKKFDETIDEIDKMRDKVHKNDHDALYATNINSVEKAHNDYRVNTVEKLYVMAGIGVAALMPAHEVQIQLKDLAPLIESVKKDMTSYGFGGRMMSRFDSIERIITILSDVSQGALELTKREHKLIPLRSVVDFSLKIKEPELRRDCIGIEVLEKEKISLKIYSNLVMTAVLNLIDNSIWWLQRKVDERKIRITIKRDPEMNIMIIVSDNGPGIDPSDLPFLGEAFYTRKPKGTGLGLFITRRAMEANDGKLDFGFYPNDPDYLTGANTVLVFEQEKGRLNT